MIANANLTGITSEVLNQLSFLVLVCLVSSNVNILYFFHLFIEQIHVDTLLSPTVGKYQNHKIPTLKGLI